MKGKTKKKASPKSERISTDNSEVLLETVTKEQTAAIGKIPQLQIYCLNEPIIAVTHIVLHAPSGSPNGASRSQDLDRQGGYH